MIIREFIKKFTIDNVDEIINIINKEKIERSQDPTITLRNFYAVFCVLRECNGDPNYRNFVKQGAGYESLIKALGAKDGDVNLSITNQVLDYFVDKNNYEKIKSYSKEQNPEKNAEDVLKKLKEFTMNKSEPDEKMIVFLDFLIKIAEGKILKELNIEEIIKKTLKVKENKQVIFTGAPGTGKTYTVREVVKEECKNNEERFKFVQFHSSYDYTDFVEGLRPAKVAGAENTTFVRMDGIFKAFCRKIVEAGLEEVSEEKGRTHQKLSDEDKEKLLEDLYNVEKKEVKDPEDKNKLDIFDGEKAEQYYFIVDEINRADLGKVFGELMFGLEESYRGIEHRFDTQYMNLPTYKIKEDKGEEVEIMSFDCFKKGFFIPGNLHFIGTMNDIDRSVESFDFALRRRFQWIEIKANEIMEESLKSMYKKEEKIQGDISKKEEENIKELSNRIINMNRLLNPEEGDTFGLSEAYHIGPAYFKSIFTDENLREQIKEEKFSWSTEGKEQLEGIFKHKIASIIREYLRGRDSSKIENLVDRCKKALIPEGIKQE